jgi:ADP-ribose pyrophosphatase YjhB (NUDIX family)
LYCIECGARLIEQQLDGRPPRVCPACGRVAYQQLKVGTGVLVQPEGRLLVVQRSPESSAFPSTWSLPAGYCEADEPPPVTAAREATEETGLQIQVGGLVDAYFFDDDPRGSGLLLVYEAEAEGEDPRGDRWCPESSEVAVAGFYRPDELPEPLCGGGHDQAIDAWRRRSFDRWQPGMPLRYCPHCTHPLEEHLAFGRRRPVCPSCGFVHFRDPKVGVSVLVERGGQVLLVKRDIEPGLGRWCLPAGFVDWDEAPEAAVVRECREETGLTVADPELLDAVHYTLDFRGPGINLVYGARVSGGILQPGDDAAVVRWFSAEDLPPRERIAFHSHHVALERWRRG